MEALKQGSQLGYHNFFRSVASLLDASFYSWIFYQIEEFTLFIAVAALAGKCQIAIAIQDRSLTLNLKLAANQLYAFYSIIACVIEADDMGNASQELISSETERPARCKEIRRHHLAISIFL